MSLNVLGLVDFLTTRRSICSVQDVLLKFSIIFHFILCLDCAANFDANVFQTSLINIKKSQDHTNSSSLTNFLTFFNLCWQQHLPKESSHWYQVVKCHVFQQCYSKLSLNTFALKRNKKYSFIIFGNNFFEEGRFGFLQSRIWNKINEDHELIHDTATDTKC